MKPVTSLVFFLLLMVSFAHLARLVLRIPVTVDGIEIPLWLSVLGFLVPLALALLLRREHGPPGKKRFDPWTNASGKPSIGE